MAGGKWRTLIITGAAAACACAPVQRAQIGSVCGAGTGALVALVDTEYAFSRMGHESIRGAFLGYLADDAVVLNPDPQPWRAIWAAAKESRYRLDWYPTVAEIAAGADLGFTSGPWTYTSADGGAQIQGHFVTVWKRQSNCLWRVAFDGGVRHAAPNPAEPELRSAQLSFLRAYRLQLPASAPAGARTIKQFNSDAERDGLAAAWLRTAREDLRLYVGGQMPIDGAKASREFLISHRVLGAWNEQTRAQSIDGDLVYAFGELDDGAGARTAAYLQIWLYDPRPNDWRMRLLLASPYAHPISKS